MHHIFTILVIDAYNFLLQVAIEIVYVSIQTFLYSLLLYSTIGFEWNVSKFLYFYYFIFMSFTYFSMYGMMIISLTPGPEIAAVVMSFFISFWNLFSGYLISRPVSKFKLEVSSSISLKKEVFS